MADPSFDVVSKVDRQEVDNAVNQAAREVATRFDFKDTGASVAWSGESVLITAATEERCKAAYEVFRDKVVRRSLSLKSLDAPDTPSASGREYRLLVGIRQGIPDDKAKALAKKIRAEGPKGVQAAIQGDQLRISGKKRDDLQAVIALLKSDDLGIALQFTNYR